MTATETFYPTVTDIHAWILSLTEKDMRDETTKLSLSAMSKTLNLYEKSLDIKIPENVLNHIKKLLEWKSM